MNPHDDFQDFLHAEEAAPPRSVSDSILSVVRRELNPNAGGVFFKLALVHLFVGALTLLLCPQFGFSFTSSMGLMSYLMRFGDGVCMFGCGAFFLGSSVLVASLILRTEEVQVIRQTRWLQLMVLSALSMSAFICLGFPVISALGGLWLAGSMIGAITSLEFGWRARGYFRRFVHEA